MMKGVDVSSVMLSGHRPWKEVDRHTFWHEPYVFTPLYVDASRILEWRSPPNLALLQLLCSGEELGLLFLQMWRRFDEIDGLDAACESLEARHSLPPSALVFAISRDATYPKHIVHQRAPPRPHLDYLHLLLLALRQPLCIQPDANKLAEDLADFGGGHEVALGAKLVLAGVGLARVVSALGSCEALSHVRSNRDGACGLPYHELKSMRAM
jgi:hypothetical protein